jgi:hypothetical protein
MPTHQLGGATAAPESADDEFQFDSLLYGPVEVERQRQTHAARQRGKKIGLRPDRCSSQNIQAITSAVIDAVHSLETAVIALQG